MITTKTTKNTAFIGYRAVGIIVTAVIVVVIAAALYFAFAVVPLGPGSVAPLPDAKNATYIVDGIAFNLVNGRATFTPSTGTATSTGVRATPGATETRTLTMFGEPVYGDLDADGDIDAAVLLAYESGGTGIFYYAALAMFDGTSPEKMTTRTTGTMFLGDRIAPQTVGIHDGRVVYNYAVRRGGEPMTTAPSVGQSTWIHYDAKTNTIGEWVKDFEGESGARVGGGVGEF